MTSVTITSGGCPPIRALSPLPGPILESMKTTIHHVARCDDCKRTTVHQSVVEHSPTSRAVTSRHECDPCRMRMDASAVLAPVLDMITARSVRDRLEVSLATGVEDLGAVAN